MPTIVAVSERYRETAQSEALPDTEKDSIEENIDYQKKRKITRLEENGIEILYVAEKNGHIDLNDLMQKLGERSIDSILLEGGGILNWRGGCKNSDRGNGNRLAGTCRDAWKR